MSEIQVGQINSTDGSTAITTGDDGTVELSAALTGTDATLSGGVYLGGTGSANYLDDYEEGTWTPVMKDTSTGGTTVGTTSVTAFYTKVGRFVHATLSIERNDASSLTGALIVTGLPFTTANYPAVNGGAWFDNVSSDWKTFVYSSISVTSAYFPKTGNIDGNLATNNWADGRYIYASFSYITT